MLKPYSTKRVKRIPEDFKQAFEALGWDKANNMFGKNFVERSAEQLGLSRRELKLRMVASRQRDRVDA
jgi:hypothetical protein